MAVEAFVTPRVLRWARAREGLSTEAAAKKLNIEPLRLDAWELGASRPTLRQAERLAEQLSVPFGYFFLSDPPPEHLPVPDLRTVSGEPPRRPSPELWDVLADALEKQSWYRDYLTSDDTPSLDFVGSHSTHQDADSIARDIRERLLIDSSLREKAHSWEEFLRLFIAQAETAGVLVLRTGIVGSNTHRPLDVDEFRGFALSDAIAPLVFINAKDAKAAQIFTLAHELVHLWVGESGISNPDYRSKATQQTNALEALCNRAAAEVLVPRDEFTIEWEHHAGTVEAKAQVVAEHFRVSRLVALRQALDLGFLDTDVYWDLYQRLISESNPVKGGGGNFYATLITRNSRTFTTTLMAALSEGSVSYTEASHLLGIKVASLDRVRERLLAQRAESVG